MIGVTTMKEGKGLKITEQNYLEQLKLQNEDALYYVMKQYGGLVKSVVHRHLYNLSQYEEDCINDVFFAVWTHISHYQKEKNPFSNWLAGIARLKALDYVRRHKNQLSEVHLEAETMDSIPEGKNVYEELENSISGEIDQLLTCLKERDRELFYRLYVGEESMDEISKDMKMDKSLLYNRLSRGKKRLQKHIRKV